ncbi:DNA-binding transcriptional LysR family regulator [Chitinivorax tropicus]|uniref:DNA-binding transcriptional LysR family regulator n=1 Tax=Chitinivorax tropicus TaxID=714531 RepID=A0A840MSC2_9PROT|nr:LysR family transcriptional regulator [Chitinivorax tropicus]MBB5019183.1 DNA-binding transcriptional LysR family regulator [Chitinivorax tropicus]
MNATFRQLQLFTALAEHGSISAAARACHVTQPTVSMQLRELSDSIGLPLYEVIGKRIFLTEAGEHLLASARVMFDEWSALAQRIDALRGLQRGTLRVAFVSTAKYFVPNLLGAFCRQYPEVDVRLSVLNREGVLQRLRANADDLYVMSQPPDDIDVKREAFLANPMVVIASRDHPLANQSSILPTVLLKERFILREVGSATRHACDRHFRALGLAPSVRLELGSNEAIKHSVSAGLGISVLSRYAIHTDPAVDGVAIIDVVGFPIHANWYIVQPSGKLLPPIAAEFLGHLRQYVEAELPVWR